MAGDPPGSLEGSVSKEFVSGSTKINEAAFEAEVEASLLAGGYARLDAAGYDVRRAMFPEDVLGFIRQTQPGVWEALEQVHGEGTGGVVFDALERAAAGERGLLDVLRHGFKCYGKRLRVAYFRPATGLNPETKQLYDANRLGVTRQLHYSARHPGRSLDLVLSVNGLPVVTMELKNPATGQRAGHAVRQYQQDRDPAEPLLAFKRRALVHFAVDPDEAWMATKLAGPGTRFLPFNQGNGTAAGNPPNPDGHRTAYLWEQVLRPYSLLDILHRFLHLEQKEQRDAATGRVTKRQTLIFPRYHQLDAVRRLEADARQRGPGRNYLVQHSAGSGKSNSIAWLAHRLSGLHDAEDRKVFDTVVVMTDRRVLDRQLQDTVYQFEHRHGVVEKIDRDSAQLARALAGGTPIVITTLQKFPFVAEKLDGRALAGRRFAVIVDEAHSGQGGEAAAEAKGVLAGERIEAEARRQAKEQELTDVEERIAAEVLKRGRQPNLSFFAFTATPKHKTLEVFGHRPDGDDPEGGRPVPFHLYSMRQAIEEGFILDVLRGYTTYKLYYALAKRAADDPKLPKREAARSLARFVSLHPHNLDQKVEVIVEHFRRHTRHRIGGRAKAMLVTESRLHAVRYKRTIDRYLQRHGLTDQVKALVAFSGSVEDEGQSLTETTMNDGIGGDRIPAAFDTPQYNLLIAADKFQTGFDQPLLHTMYVDKRLAGIQAVQTLSRLNRMAPGKEETFVLDFRNERDEVLAAFQDYYETTGVADEADPQQLYDLQAQLDASGVYHDAEVHSFCEAFFTPLRGGKTAGQKPTAGQHAAMNAAIDVAVDRFKLIGEEGEEREQLQEQFRGRLAAFCSLYRFLAQVMPFGDSDLEKLYAFGRVLLKKLPRDEVGPNLDLADDVALKSYRLQKISEGRLDLQADQPGELPGPQEVGTGRHQQEEAELSSLIHRLNDRFGTDFTTADQLFFDAVAEDATADPQLQQAAAANPASSFDLAFGRVLQSLFIDRMGQNEAIVARFMTDSLFRENVEQAIGREVYDRLQQQAKSA